MPQILHLAPVGTDKTSIVLARLRETLQSPPHALPTVWALLATRRQQLSFRQRLIDQDEQVSSYFNIEFFNFYSLNARLLKIARQSARRLKPLSRLVLLRRLLAEMLAQDELAYFHRIATTRGFAAILAELFDELKQARVDFADFEAAAKSEKDSEIARIYRRYQELLIQSDFADVEGEGWLALAKTRERRDIASRVDLLLVDGYDQFTLVQAQMLAALSRSISDVHITLMAPPDGPSQSLPHRSVIARERLRQAFADAQLDLTIETSEARPDNRHADLERLCHGIFGSGRFESSGEAIQLIEMPSPAEEVKTVLRRIKRQLLDGVQAEDILVAVRDWDRYATYFESGRDEYELPLLLHYERSLHKAPVIALLIELLGLTPRFRRRDLLDVLRSPYIDAGLDDEHIDLLDKLSMEQRFLGGSAAAWLDIVRLSGAAPRDDREDKQRTLLGNEQRDELVMRLSAFFEGISPPERAKVPDYVSWLENLLGKDPHAEDYDRERPEDACAYSLHIIERAVQTDDLSAEIVGRDIMALHGLRRILRELSASDDALRATFGAAGTVGWQRFWSDLKHALETTAIEPVDRSRAGQVLVTTATEARGLPHKHVYILGLAEGVFPAEITEDPLYFDSEREEMRRRGVPLETKSERTDDQGLFYELVSLPQDSLTLSRPTFQAGKVWNESHLWRAVRGVFPKLSIESRTVGSVIAPKNTASGAELMMTIAAHQSSSDARLRDSALRMKAWMQTQQTYAAPWQRVVYGRRVEHRRFSFSPFDHYSGILTRPHLLGVVADELGSEHVWSATELNDYGLCGFRYFAKRMLKLETVEEPDPDISALQLGLLSHSILEKTYRRIRTRGLDIDESNAEAALSIFNEQAAVLLKDAPQDYGFFAGATWEERAKLLRKRLAALVQLDFSAESPLSRFGAGRQVRMLERYFDEALIEMPEDMPALRVAGFIDRIDWADDELVLVDYKTGSGAISRRQMEIGRDFQMLVYALALEWAERNLPGEPRLAGGLFWHLRNLKASGVYDADSEDDQAALETARQHLARNVTQGRHGQFPVHATELERGKCARYCEYSHLCRMRVTSRFKSLPPA
ncbi:MAG: exodeoxyribonuclease V subunit gamma [Chloroflexota bacterium]|nr:exodeoxyribonuclease V subunit gamma [Chloroflexota bacterium]